ncbi:MAG: hypothetical protein K2J81_09630, partial [Treponemataceae bacterium]|nr:hypothetical protein [Treponemataceae bacterium]
RFCGSEMFKIDSIIRESHSCGQQNRRVVEKIMSHIPFLKNSGAFYVDTKNVDETAALVNGFCAIFAEFLRVAAE